MMKHTDCAPPNNLPLTIENLGRKREEEGQSYDGNGSSTPRPYYLQSVADTPSAANPVPNDFIMLGKLKTVVNEVLTCLGAPGNNYDLEDYIAVTEECLVGLKTLKVERRIEARRANNNVRPGNPVICNPIQPPATPTVADEIAEERPTTPVPTSYMAALMRKKTSPKHSPSRTEMLTRDDVEATRQASALRGEERQRIAEERRLDRLQEMKLKSEAAEAREQRVKARREEAELRQRVEAEDRLENGRKRAEEARKQTVEKAQKTQSRVDEVRLTNDLRRQTKVLLLDKKMSDVEHNQEVRKEARQSRAQEKNEAMEAAAERRRNLSEERAEKQKEREQQRQEKLRRLEEQKKQEQEQKQLKTEEREKNVLRRQQEVSAETEALSKKTEEKMQQSALVLEEQREKRRQKQERQEQKLKEVKTRKEENEVVEVKPTLEEFVPPLTSQEEEQLAQRTSKLVAASARQGKAFCDTYQKESLGSPKDLNRSRLRPGFSRLASATASSTVSQFKQPLNDLLAADLTVADHEFVRYFNQFEILVKAIAEARKQKEFSLMEQATDFLLVLLTSEEEGRNNVMYFVRSGSAIQLMLCIREEMKMSRQHNKSDSLRWMLSCIGVCLERLSKEPNQSKLSSVRDQFMNDLDTLALDRVCLAVVKMNPSEEDLELVHCALCIINVELAVMSKRKGDVKLDWFHKIVDAFFSLLQSVLTPGGVPVSRDSTTHMSCGRITVLFCVFRTLNVLARWQLVPFQALLHDRSSCRPVPVPVVNASTSPLSAYSQRIPTAVLSGIPKNEDAPGSNSASNLHLSPIQLTRAELYHVLNDFFLYIQEHLDELETIPSDPALDGTGVSANPATQVGLEPRPSLTSASSVSTSAILATTFEDAVKYGLTLHNIPAYPPTDLSATSQDAYRPGGKSYPLRAALHECILLIGYLCIDDPSLQEMLSWGEKKPLLANILNVLPAQYFSNAQHILFPTVLAVVCDNVRNTAIAKTEMDLNLLHGFVTTELNALSKGAKAYAAEHHRQLTQFKIETDPKRAIQYSLSKVSKKSWADSVEEDVIEVRTNHSTDTTSTTPALEKEKLCKLFQSAGQGAPSFTLFYKVDRRLPITYWPCVIEQLEDILDIKPN